MGYKLLLISLSTLLICCLVPPLAWHIKCRNIPAVILILWLLLASLKILVDASIWSDDNYATRWEGHVWCDIMIRVQQGTDSGVVCAITLIALNLLLILYANDWTEAWFKYYWRKCLVELFICLPTPIFVMATNYIVLNSRYVILRYSGCQSSYSDSWLTNILFAMWPFIWSIILFVLSVATILKYFSRRRDVKDVLKTTESGLTIRRFARLLIFCILIVLFMLPLSTYFFVSDIRQNKAAFEWLRVHSPIFWGFINHADIGVVYDRWIICALSYITFIIFGLGSDAIGMYLQFLRFVGLGGVLDNLKEFKDKRKLKFVRKMKEKWLKKNGSEELDVERQEIEIYDKESNGREMRSLEGSSLMFSYGYHEDMSMEYFGEHFYPDYLRAGVGSSEDSMDGIAGEVSYLINRNTYYDK